MNRKMILLDLIAQAHEEEKEFIAALTEEERSRIGTPDRWSAKDAIAHNAAWKGRMAKNLLAVSEGRAPRRAEDFDFGRENAALFEEHRAKTWDEVMALADRAYLRLVEQVEGLQEEELTSYEVFHWQRDRPLWRLIVGTGYNHPLTHMAEHHRNRGDSARAGELIGEMASSLVDLDDSPTWQGVVRYNLACHYSLLEQKGAAIDELRAALQLNPGLEDWSKQDPDLGPIRGEPGYQSIYERWHHLKGFKVTTAVSSRRKQKMSANTASRSENSSRGDREMRVSECVGCEAFPCSDVRHECYIIPDVDLKPDDVSIVMISEAAPADPADYYYAAGNPLFEQTTVQAFNDAGAGVSTIQDILDLGVYLTTAVKCGKTGYGIQAGTIKECSRILENELALFPNVEAFLLMGDVAIKVINYIAQRVGEGRVIPAGSTYKIRGQEYFFRGKRAFPSYLQAGPSFFIEKSKRRMIAEDIAAALSLVA